MPNLLGIEFEWWYKVGDPLCEERSNVLKEYETYDQSNKRKWK